MEEILIITEHRQGNFREVTFELVGFATGLAEDRNLSVAAVVLGLPKQNAEKLQQICDTVLFSEEKRLADYNAPDYLATLCPLIADRRPRLVVMGHTAQGMDLAPALALAAGIPLVTDCLDFQWNETGAEVNRQLYAGKIGARFTLKPADAHMITLRPGEWEAPADTGKTGILESLPVPDTAPPGSRRFIEYLAAGTEDVNIQDADILVSVGRGIGKPENIPLAEALAQAVGGTLSCSRPVADNEWLPKSRQVGTSGKTVRPKLYIALGISGAFQHQAGMKNAETIIAVNTDPAAPIFSVAHYGIVGDILEVLPILTEQFSSP
jgi:electron transfer flavoprotein alpha subunit